MADHGQKTEKATPRRLQKARDDGRFFSSREFLGAVHFLLAVTMLSALSPQWLLTMQESMRGAFRAACQREGPDIAMLLHTLILRAAMSIAAAAAVLMMATLGLQLAMTGVGFSFKRLMPDFSRLNPGPRLKALPRNGLTAAVEAMVLLPVAGYLIWTLTKSNLPALMAIPFSSISWGARQLGSSLMQLLWKAGALLLLFGGVDLFRKTTEYRRDLRMSKQDVREEMKESEGNSQIKGRIRRLQRALIRRQMLKAVPTATAVIVNPTHYAVALKYDLSLMLDPVVVAKGKNLLAQRIRELAINNQVPIFEQPPLARALYETVGVGQQIPSNFYRAVAEILAYVYRHTGGRPRT